MDLPRPRLGDTRNLPDHWARAAFKHFDDMCDAFYRMTEEGRLHSDGDMLRALFMIRQVGQEFIKFIDLYREKQDHDPAVMQQLINHQVILSEIGLLE